MILDKNRCNEVHKCGKQCLFDKYHDGKHFDENTHHWEV